MVSDAVRRRIVSSAAIFGLLVGVVSACTAKKEAGAAGAGAPSASSSASPGVSSSPEVPPAVLTFAPQRGAVDVNPTTPVTVRVGGGVLVGVTVKNPAGVVLKGAMAANKLSWSSVEPLGYDRSYAVTVKTTDAAGRAAVETTRFSTLKPNNLTMPYINTGAGQAISPGDVFGVGQVVKIHFDEPITNRHAAQAAVHITTTPAQLGGFSWIGGNQDLFWRTRKYLATATKVNIAVKAYGVDFGNKLYGQADAATWFKVGAKQVSIADDVTKLVSVYRNGKLVRTMPTSMGRHASIPGDTGPIDLRTNSGPHVVIDSEQNINMNSASFGLSKGANAYKTIVPVGVKISYDGEYVHWADWSIWAQGNTDTSHGCLNVSPDNAYWFASFSQPGDIVDVRNTGRPLAVWNSGYWTQTWAEWLAGAAK
jgi:lipoprotein-anchoring transpeptidase ErfK/SrfK